MKHQDDWYFEHKRPYDTKIVIYISQEDLANYLNGDYSIVWSTSKSKISDEYNSVVELHIHPMDYSKLCKASIVDNINPNQLTIQFEQEYE